MPLRTVNSEHSCAFAYHMCIEQKEESDKRRTHTSQVNAWQRDRTKHTTILYLLSATTWLCLMLVSHICKQFVVVCIRCTIYEIHSLTQRHAMHKTHTHTAQQPKPISTSNTEIKLSMKWENKKPTATAANNIACVTVNWRTKFFDVVVSFSHISRRMHLCRLCMSVCVLYS